MGKGRRRFVSGSLGPVTVGALLVLTPLLASPTAATYPKVPIALDSRFLTNLSAPELTPGEAGSVGYSFVNPLTTALTNATVSFEVYAFNPYPGQAGGFADNSSGLAPGAPSPLLSSGPQQGTKVRIGLPNLGPGASASVPIAVSAAAGLPEGTYAIRTAAMFDSAGTGYFLESRGFLSTAQWANATSGGNGTLNVSRLPVSGVLPETAVLIRNHDLALPLYLLLGAAFLLAGAGAYFAWRGGPGSRSGARGLPDDQRAPSAFGKSRTNDGD